MASHSRMLARNLLPSPAPSDAPFTMPAMSTNVTGAGTIFSEREDLGELVEPRIGQRDHALVRLDRRERIVGGQHVVARQRVEQRRLADVGQSDDSQVEAHGLNSLGVAPVVGAPARAGSALARDCRYGRRVSGQRGRSAVAADHRSALPRVPGIPWWGAAIVASHPHGDRLRLRRRERQQRPRRRLRGVSTSSAVWPRSSRSVSPASSPRSSSRR